MLININRTEVLTKALMIQYLLDYETYKKLDKRLFNKTFSSFICL